jgi:hypothetical protein
MTKKTEKDENSLVRRISEVKNREEIIEKRKIHCIVE